MSEGGGAWSHWEAEAVRGQVQVSGRGWCVLVGSRGTQSWQGPRAGMRQEAGISKCCERGCQINRRESAGRQNGNDGDVLMHLLGVRYVLHIHLHTWTHPSSM